MDAILLQQAATRLTYLRKQQCFDPIDFNSRPTPRQDEFFKDVNSFKLRMIRAGGQAGKTGTVAREVAWILEGTHPYWTRPEAWGDEPLLILVAGQDRKMMELEIWNKKLKPLLQSADWKEVRSGNALQQVTHRKHGHVIAFLSHSDSSETNRKHLQGYVGHYVWMDELSDNISIIEELQRRVVARDGWFSLSFTPKGKSTSIRAWADSIAEPYGKVYRMGQLDNPLFASRLEEVKARVAGMPEGLRNTVLYGDWEAGDKNVYDFDKTSMVERPPEYSAAWRHVESSDPAVAGIFGLTVWAEDPSTGIWYCIRGDYIKGISSPDDIVKEVKKRTDNYNIVRRVVDPHEAWYIGMANKMGLLYVWPRNKNDRKDELIKGLQLALTSGKIKIAPWCSELISELQGAQWAESDNAKSKIQGSKNLHLSDAAQYFIDCAPKGEDIPLTRSWEEELRAGNKERKKLLALTAGKITRKKWSLSKNGNRRIV